MGQGEQCIERTAYHDGEKILSTLQLEHVFSNQLEGFFFSLEQPCDVVTKHCKAINKDRFE